MSPSSPQLTLHLAASEADLEAAQRLRYDVFVRELGSDGAMVDHARGLERDRFDPFCDHLLLRAGGEVVGVYRLMRQAQAEAAGQFYCDDEYDLEPLRRTGRNLLELGRSCLAPQWRGSSAMYVIWQGLADYVARHEIEILFGVASFHGTDLDALAPALSLLHHSHLSPPDIRVRSRAYQPMDLLAPEAIDRKAAMLSMPALIKGYLRLGGTIGDGAFVDHAFNTTDVMLVMDTARLNEKAAGRYRQ